MAVVRVLLLVGGVAVVGVLVVLAVAALIRGAARGWPTGRVATDPTVDPFAPAAVEGGRGVTGVAVAVLVWSAANVLLAWVWIAAAAGQWPTGEGFLPPLQPLQPQLQPSALSGWDGSLLAACSLGGLLIVGGGLSLAGAVGLLRHRPVGRRLIAWGQFLMGLLACVVGGVFALAAAGVAATHPAWIAAAPWWALAAGLHLLTDLTLGAAAQQVGKTDRRFDLKPIA